MIFYGIRSVRLISLALVITCATAVALRAETAAPTIWSMSKKANEVAIYHTPERLMGSLGRSRDTVIKNAVVIMRYNCDSTCDLEIKKLLDFLSSAEERRVIVSGDVSTAIVFSYNGKEVGRVYGHWSGLVISVGGDNFILKKSLSEYLETHSPFQW